MTKILANNTHGQQIIFNSFSECAQFYNISQVDIKKRIDSGEHMRTEKGIWFFDYF